MAATVAEVGAGPNINVAMFPLDWLNDADELPRFTPLTAQQSDGLAERMEQVVRHSFATSLPNVLTYARIAAVPLLVACLYFLQGDAARWSAFALFVAAALTDWLDGYLARAWAQQSTLGRMLDPIADKLIVGATLLMLVYDHTISGLYIWAAVIILCREILVSGLREFLAELNVKVHVSQLAKWKTALQMVALAVLLAGPAADKLVPDITTLGLLILWVAALLTLWTGYDYLKAGVRHAMER